VIGQNASEIADADTITVSTYVTDTNYEFVGWYIDNDRADCLSTAYSCRIAKSVAYKHTLVAVYRLKTETGHKLCNTLLPGGEAPRGRY